MSVELKPGYKQTEVGVIPEDWEVKALGDLSDIYRGASPRPIDSPIWFDEKSQIGWVRISDVTKSKRRLQETTQRLSEIGVRHSRFVPKGSLIMSICATVGRPVITDIDVCIHDGFVVFERPRILQDFLYHSLKALESGWSKSGQTGSQMNLNTGIINPTRIPLPPTKAEQEAIAGALSDADALIESLEQLIAKKRHIKQGAMQELLTGKKRLPGFQVKPGYKQTEIGVIPEDWICESLESMSAFITKGSTPTTYGYKWEQSGILFLRSECVSEKGLDLTQSMFISTAAHASLRRSEVCDGDILVTITGNVGRVVYLSGVGCANLNQHIARVRVTSIQTDRRYVYHFLSQPSVQRNFNTITTGQAYPQISLKQVREALVRLPSTKAEQTAIATILSDMDTEIAALETQLAKTRALKQGMMHNLLTGKIRLL